MCRCVAKCVVPVFDTRRADAHNTTRFRWGRHCTYCTLKILNQHSCAISSNIGLLSHIFRYILMLCVVYAVCPPQEARERPKCIYIFLKPAKPCLSNLLSMYWSVLPNRSILYWWGNTPAPDKKSASQLLPDESHSPGGSGSADRTPWSTLLPSVAWAVYCISRIARDAWVYLRPLFRL